MPNMTVPLCLHDFNLSARLNYHLVEILGIYVQYDDAIMYAWPQFQYYCAIIYAFQLKLSVQLTYHLVEILGIHVQYDSAIMYAWPQFK